MSSKGKKKPKLRKGKKPLVPKWKLFRANEPLLSVFMWGVNHSIMELSHVPPPSLLLPDDFKGYSKIKVDNHGFNKDNMPSHFKVKEYCPNVFRNLRERFGVDDSEYLRSLTAREAQRSSEDKRLIFSHDEKLCIKIVPAENAVELQQNISKYHKRSLTYDELEISDSSGRSGAKFYTSADLKFVVKTLVPEEVAEVHSLLKAYHEYIVEKHGKTLLPQYLGMYRLTVDGSESYLIVMRNIFGRKYPIHKKYDLKGSTVQRQAKEKEKAKDLPTLKDIDFLEDVRNLYLPDDAKTKLIEMLTGDTTFLAKLHLMDYSLLVGIHDLDQAARDAAKAEAEQAEGRGGDSSEPDGGTGGSEEELGPTPPDSPLPSTGAFAPLNSEGGLELDREFYAIHSKPDAPKNEIYFIGLVDILTYYGVKKRTASAAKTVKYGAEAGISTVKPHQYARRLLDFTCNAIDANPQSIAPPLPSPPALEA